MSKSGKFDFSRIKKQARDFRSNMTDAEKVLWEELRKKRVSGYRFLKQHPILFNGNLVRYNYFIADFYCHELKVVIEVDGPVHMESKEYDDYRDSEMEHLGLHVLRIKNEELENIDKVVEKINLFITQITR